jgi:alpha-beta hydrolase superfamily lysophospholipase
LIAKKTEGVRSTIIRRSAKTLFCAWFLALLTGILLLIISGCTTAPDKSVYDTGKTLPELTSMFQYIRLDPKKSTDYPEEVKKYFIYYGLDFPGTPHFFGTFRSKEKTIAAHVFLPKDSTKTVFLVHGFLLHTFAFNHLIKALIDHGYAVAAFDLPGHGFSSGARADIGDFSEYADVIDDFIGYLGSSIPQPYAIVGHSTGCSAIFEYLNTRASVFRKHVLCGPLIRSDFYDLSRFGLNALGWAMKDVPTLVADVSSDDTYIDFIRNKDPLRPKTVPLSWVRALVVWNERLDAHPKVIDSDVLVMQGDKDSVVDFHYNLEFLKQRIQRLEICMIWGGKHELTQEAQPILSTVINKIIVYLSSD